MFWTFWDLESAEIASNKSKQPLKRRTRPCISLESSLKTFLLKHAQSLSLDIVHFSFFVFYHFFFSPSSFLFFLSFCCSCWPSTRLLLSSRISEKALTRQEILAMDKQRVGRGNFPLSFLLKFQNVLVHISSSINPIGLVWVLLERPRPAPQLEHKWCLSGSKVMRSQVATNAQILDGWFRAFQVSMG